MPLGFIAAGILLLLRDLDVLPSDFSAWPLVIIIVGLSILVGGADRRRRSE